MTTNDHKADAATTRGGAGADSDQVAAHHDAAFYHESAAFHHRQAAQHMANGQPEDAERHVWAAFGHSLNAHESTRAGVSAMRAPAQSASTGPADAPTPDGLAPRHGHN